MDVLICGAGAAVLSLAQLLGTQGRRVTVVEAAPAVGNGGLRNRRPRRRARDREPDGDPRDAAPGAGPHADGHPLRRRRGPDRRVITPELVANEFDEEGEHDVEVSREILNDALLAAVDPMPLTQRFSTTIHSLDEDAEGVQATLSDGDVRRFDLVVGADGLHSAVRRMTFGPEAQFVHHLGIYVALFEVTGAIVTDPGVRMYNTPGHMCGLLNYGDRTVASTMFRSPFLDHDFRDVARQKDIVRAAFREGDRLAGRRDHGRARHARESSTSTP